MSAATTPAAIRALLTEDPFARQLLESPIPARLAYTALDGTPRAIPIAYFCDGERFVLATTEGAEKVAALEERPEVALTIDTESQPPVVLLVRGTVTISMVDGVVPEYLEANRRMVGEEGFPAFEREVTALYDRMARIELTPTWAKVLDFQTRIPDNVRRVAEAKNRQARAWTEVEADSPA